VWAIDLPRARSGITLDEFLGKSSACTCTPPPLVRGLLNIRLLVGRLLGWDREPAATAWASFATRLTTVDRSRSLATAGKREGLFRVVYRFANEQLLELINRTVHAAVLSALVETADAYRFYFAVYVENVSRLTPIYMALVDRSASFSSIRHSFALSALAGIKYSAEAEVKLAQQLRVDAARNNML